MDITEALTLYERSVEIWSDIYSKATDDMKFTYDIDDGQWPAEVDGIRGANRPKLTINKVLKFVRNVKTDFLMNKPSLKVIPVDDRADVQKAEIYQGIIRQIEYMSSADIVYSTAYAQAVASSVGFFRITTDYVGDSFDQEIKLKRILNPTSVHYGPGVEFSLEDAPFCFIEDSLSRDEYKRKYPDAQLIDFDGGRKFSDWFDEDNVRVAELFWKEYVERERALLSNGMEVWLGKGTNAEIKAAGLEIVKKRTVTSHKIMWQKMSGHEILDGPKEWPGKYIPIIPMFGDEIVIEGKKHYLSFIRGAKDPARMLNYWSTAATENVALSPKAPFIIDARQIKGFETEWDEANIKNRMYLRYKALTGIEKPRREPQTGIPAAIIGMIQQMSFDIEDHLGMYEASKGAPSNERSGKAIERRVEQSQKGAFTFYDNSARSLIYAGKQIIDLIPKVYDTERQVRLRNETGTEKIIVINRRTLNDIGEIEIENNLSEGRYDLISTVGTAYSSKRAEMAEMMVQSMQYAPNLADIIAPLVFKYSDWPGANEIYEEIKGEIERRQSEELATAQGAQQKPV